MVRLQLSGVHDTIIVKSIGTYTIEECKTHTIYEVPADRGSAMMQCTEVERRIARTNLDPIFSIVEIAETKITRSSVSASWRETNRLSWTGGACALAAVRAMSSRRATE